MKILRVTAPVLTVAIERLAATVAFYERALGEPVRARFRNPAGTLDLVLIGAMLLIGGSPAALAARSELKATYIVDSLDEWLTEVTRSWSHNHRRANARPSIGCWPGRIIHVRATSGRSPF
jgi:hypothetical protein